jgi:hypothetical protein
MGDILRPETAPYVGCHDPDTRWLDMQDMLGDRIANRMRLSGIGDQCPVARRLVEGGEIGARLDRCRDETRHMRFERHDIGCLCEEFGGQRRIAVTKIEQHMRFVRIRSGISSACQRRANIDDRIVLCEIEQHRVGAVERGII